MADIPSLSHDSFSFEDETHFFCRHCKTITNQILKGSFTHRRWGPAGWWHDIEYSLWSCAGCETGSMKEVESVAEVDEHPREFFDPIFYPKNPTFGDSEVHPKQFINLPERLNKIYRETIKAFDDDLDILCAGGLRSLIEGICDDKELSGKRDNLEKKINALTKLGLPNNIVGNLHGFRFLGNTALHELSAPSRDDLRLAIEIIEDLMNFVYDLNYKAEELKRSQQENRIHFKEGEPDLSGEASP